MADEYEQQPEVAAEGGDRKRKAMEEPVAAEGDMSLSCKDCSASFIHSKEDQVSGNACLRRADPPRVRLRRGAPCAAPLAGWTSFPISTSNRGTPLTHRPAPRHHHPSPALPGVLRVQGLHQPAR